MWIEFVQITSHSSYFIEFLKFHLSLLWVFFSLQCPRSFILYFMQLFYYYFCVLSVLMREVYRVGYTKTPLSPLHNFNYFSIIYLFIIFSRVPSLIFLRLLLYFRICYETVNINICTPISTIMIQQ